MQTNIVIELSTTGKTQWFSVRVFLKNKPEFAQVNAVINGKKSIKRIHNVFF